MKRFISLVLAFVLVFSYVGIMSHAQETRDLYKDGNFEFYVVDDSAYITKVYSDGTGIVDFTARVCCDDDRKIGTIEVNDLEDDDNNAPDGFGIEYALVVGVLPDALNDFTEEITVVDISKHLVDFEVSMFYNLTNLAEIKVSENNSSFSAIDGSLYNKDGTKLLFHPQASTVNTIADSVKELAPKAFYYSSKISSVTLPAAITTIPESCFENCSITSIDISACPLTSIEKYAFSTSGLTAISLPESIKVVKTFAFFNCSALETVTIPDAVSGLIINTCAFFGCPISDLYIPRGVEQIAKQAFGFYYDTNNDAQKYSGFQITSYKYNEDKSEITEAYRYASDAENGFKFIPLDDIYTVNYAYPYLNGYETTMYLYDKLNLAYSVTSDNGVFELQDIAAGKYNVYFKSKFGLLVAKGSVDIVKDAEKELYNYATDDKAPLGQVTEYDDIIDINDVQALLQVGVYGTTNPDYDIDLDGYVGMSDISVILSSVSFSKTDAEIKDAIVSPIFPISN